MAVLEGFAPYFRARRRASLVSLSLQKGVGEPFLFGRVGAFKVNWYQVSEADLEFYFRRARRRMIRRAIIAFFVGLSFPWLLRWYLEG